MASLMLSTHGRIFRIVRLREGQTLVGRSPQCNLVVERPAISNFHAVFVARDATVTLRDLQSTNGTLVNGKRVSVTPVGNGDVIRICDVEMEFVQKDLFGADELPASTGIPEAPPLASETVAGALEPAPASRNGRDSRVGGAAGPSWTGDAVSFCIMAQGREVQAYITADALLTHFSVLVYGPDGPARAVAAYEENYVSINVVAWKRFAETGREPIRIRTSDFED